MTKVGWEIKYRNVHVVFMIGNTNYLLNDCIRESTLICKASTDTFLLQEML
jgi:hypothetical protein